MIRTFSHPGAPERIHTNALDALRLKSGLDFQTTTEPFPEILYFLTGGSEAEAVQCLSPDTFQVLLADGRSNAFASAMEVKALSNKKGCRNTLLCLDDPHDMEMLKHYRDAMIALQKLKGKRLGLIGTVSEWLVASTIEDDVLKSKLGIDLVNILWDDAGRYSAHQATGRFLSCFSAGRQYNIEDAGKVSSQLEQIITAHKLDAITVECFSLVQENSVTACLGLSFLNDNGIAAGCEGDLCSITGMMLAQARFGSIPWMANVAGIKGREVLLAHCTAPTNVLSEYHVNTHYETAKGTAVQGRYKEREVSLFRLSNTLDDMFIAQGTAVDGMYEKQACRTQLRIVLEEDDIQQLKHAPLGNHHLVLPGRLSSELKALKDIICG